jgi:hypothetical protein
MEIKSFGLTDTAALNEFIKYPFKLYKGTPYGKFWVPPLIADVKKLFSNENPFFKHAKIKFFMAYETGKPVGRVAAIVDQNHIKFHNEKCGFFGYYESINDVNVTKRIMAEAKEYLKGEGMEIIRGPFNPSTNDEIGFLLEGFDSPPVVMMPYTPPYYLCLFEQADFLKAKDLHAYFKPTTEDPPEKIRRIVEKVKKRENLKFRNFDMNDFDNEVKRFKEIYNSAWEKNWGFVPMTDEELDFMAKALKPIIDPRLAHFIEVDGKPVGSTLCVPDFNFVLKRLNGRLGPIGILKYFYYKGKIPIVRLMTLGVIKEYRNRGLEAILYNEIFLATRKAGYVGGEMSWTLEDNDLINRGIEAMGGKLYKKYRIYEAKLG